MLDHDAFRRLYALVAGDQTVDEGGAAVDCGVRCDKHCCRPGHTTKYLLPGERSFLEAALEERGDPPFSFKSLGYFETIVEPPERPCACEPLRELRPFNCRIFPYGPVVEGRKVTGLLKGKQSYLEPCWITVPAPRWRDDAIAAWQMVLDDEESRDLFARLCTLWEWNQALERGEDPGPVLYALSGLDAADTDERWARAGRFFKRGE
jgi:hypothetical protein